MTGLTPKEQIVMDFLTDAWKVYIDLKPLCDDDKREFMDAIHKLQRLLAVRIVRRDYPSGWTQK